MGEELLIDFGDSLKTRSDIPKVEYSTSAEEEIKLVPDLCSFIGDTLNSNSEVISNFQKKCILDNDYDELIPQLKSPMKVDLGKENDLIGLSPFNCLRANKTNILESDLIAVTSSSNLMSPFGLPVNVKSKNVTHDVNLHNSVPIGQLLPVQDESKSSNNIDVFDVEVLERISDIKQSKINYIKDEINSVIPSIPSNVSDDSQCSSFGLTINGSTEKKSPTENPKFLKSPNDSVFEEAQAIAEELMRMAKCEADVEGIEMETSSVVSSCSDLDDIELIDMKLIGNELDELLDIYAIENNDDLVEEGNIRKMDMISSKLGFKNHSETDSMDGARTFLSSSLSISPLPLSTERLNHIKLRASEATGASMKFTSLKKNTFNHPTTVASRNGPLKALVPLSQIVKNSVSPVGVVSAKPRGMKLTETSPDFPRPFKTSQGVLSSTPVLCKNRNQAKQIPSVSKGLSGNLKGAANNVKSNHEATLTPSSKRSSITDRTQDPGKKTSIARPIVNRKASIPSPVTGKRNSNSTPSVKAPVSRSISTGHLPLTPSMRKVNGATNIQNFQSPLRRTNSLSAKLSVGTPSRTLKPSINSPAMGGTPLDKLISKFRRVSVSRGMKENLSPGKY